MTEPTPLVSVVIPTYNRSNFMSQAIDSVLDQTFTDFEIIVVDDGSTDDTASVCETYSDKVKYVYQENQGRSEARNTGMRAARGQYIAFLDDDDLFLPDHLQLQVDYLELHPDIGMVYGTFILVDEDLNPLEDHPPVSCTTYPDMLWKSVEIATPTVMLRSKVVEQIGFFDPQFEIIEEIDYFIRVAKITRIGEINQPLSNVLQHPGNSERGPHPKVFKNKLLLLDKHLQAPTDINWWLRNRIYGRFFGYWTLEWLNMGDNGQKMIRQYFFRILRYAPWHYRRRLLIARLLFRKLVPDPIKSRLRPLWRKS